MRQLHLFFGSLSFMCSLLGSVQLLIVGSECSFVHDAEHTVCSHPDGLIEVFGEDFDFHFHFHTNELC